MNNYFSYGGNKTQWRPQKTIKLSIRDLDLMLKSLAGVTNSQLTVIYDNLWLIPNLINIWFSNFDPKEQDCEKAM
jgi:hypothetical protein